jgi:hypothetical protein
MKKNSYRRSGIFSICIILLLSVLVTSCFLKKPLAEQKTVVLPFGDTVSILDGSLVYALPMTVFEITVDLERTIERPGPYAKYAGDMLGIRDVITQENESWAIQGIKVNATEELDPSEYYVIESNTLVETNALALKKSGLIMDLNPAFYEGDEAVSRLNDGLESPLQFKDMGADEYFVSQNDTAYRVVRLDTAFVKIPYLVERKKQLNLEQLADKAAKTLLELREGKHLILTGEATVFPQDRAAIDEMNRLEREYTALFAGKTIRVSKSVKYSFIPQKDIAGKDVVIFRFSEATGAWDASSKNGTPVTLTLEPVKKTKDLTIVTRPGVDGEPVKNFDKLYYRVPDVAVVKISLGTQNLYNARKLIYQLGEVIQLPANFIIGK